MADDIEAAVRERLGHIAVGKTLTADLQEVTAVSLLDAAVRPRKGRLVNLDSKKLAGHLTREIASYSDDYSLTRRWAAAFIRDGWVGARYRPRFTPGSVFAQAWFATQGAHTDLPSTPVPDWFGQLGFGTASRLVAKRVKIEQS